MDPLEKRSSLSHTCIIISVLVFFALLAPKAALALELEASSTWNQSNMYEFGATLADLDGDGTLDIIAASGDVSVFAWHANGTLVSWWPVNVYDNLFVSMPGWVKYSPLVADINNDTYPEIVFDDIVGNMYAYDMDGNPLWGDESCSEYGIFDAPAALEDFDGDGLMEIVASCFFNKTVFIFNSDGSTVPGWDPLLTYGDVSTAPAIGYLDDDDFPDVVVAGQNLDFFSAFSQAFNSSGNESWFSDMEMSFGLPFTNVIGNVDDDDGNEVVVTLATLDNWVYVLDGTDGSVESSWTGPPFSDPSETALADLDGDGDQEIIVYWGDTVYAWHGNGTELWSYMVVGGESDFSISINVSDIDMDGNPEVLVPSGNSLYILSNMGNLLWNQSFVDGSYNYTVQNPLVGDVDGDGKNEVVFGTKHKYPYVNDYVIYVYSQPNHPPSVTVTAPANGSVWNESDNVTFSYNVSDENAVSSCSLFIGGEERDNSSNVSKGSLQHFSQNLSNGRYEWSVTCRDEYGKEGSSGVLVLDVDYQPPEPPEPAPEEKPKRRSSGGGLYRPPEPLPSVTKLWGRVMPGDELSMTLEKEGVAIRMIVMEVNEESMSVSLEVTGLEEKPADIEEAGGSVYQYLSIEQSNLESLDSAVIGFCVNRSWVESNGLDEEDVVLNRYSDGWKPLNTSLVSEGGGEFCYEASTPGFSYFAITGSEQAVIGEDSCGNGRCDSQETCVSCPEDCGECHEEAGTAGEGTVPASEGTDNGGITGLITFLLSWLALPLFLIVAALILASAVILQRR